ncbi:hypothetical protein K2X30_04715 [bacterium]|jgi:ABC-type nickel/cobalt efflux system permease component RcnA|nr:hypothetical protein [bacterium]
MQSTLIFALSAAAVGFVHSLSPGHWLPVVLVAKSRKWSPGMATLGALALASGHILLSLILGIVGLEIGSTLILQHHEATIERYGAILVIVFGAIYAFIAYRRHSSCHGHGHHGPDAPKGPKYQSSRSVLLFLFSLGFSPCIAVFPVFAAAAMKGTATLVIAMAAFALSVVGALVLAAQLAVHGLTKLDHPVLEHYGDLITGLCVIGLGAFLYFFP